MHRRHPRVGLKLASLIAAIVIVTLTAVVILVEK